MESDANNNAAKDHIVNTFHDNFQWNGPAHANKITDINVGVGAGFQYIFFTGIIDPDDEERRRNNMQHNKP